ncbi:MAG: A/G-specific adenine glycosylase [Deltaproteobacteria bacterium]|nr:A/G-specific adenine glycosylase [Deltaproteobacteria bacterium]
MAATRAGFAKSLLSWYDRERRDLPWRGQSDPYRVWISEAMLQQTVVATVIPYYQRFLRAFPTVQALARAPEGDVLHAWAGLGYYSRARSLKRAAQMVVEEFGGRMPATEAQLLRLPGVGPYTAAAVAAIAYGHHTFPLDGNAIRVMARLANDDSFIDDDATKQALRNVGQALVPRGRAGDFAQAVMDLGARVCLPRTPKCDVCPVARFCEARVQGTAKELPRRRPRRPKKPVRLMCIAMLCDDDVLLLQQPSKGLLGGTWTLPSVTMADDEPVPAAALRIAASYGLRAQIQVSPSLVHHVFTHLDVKAHVALVTLKAATKAKVSKAFPQARWIPCADASSLPLASFTKKLLACVGAR